ncbi:hypothetical protein, conserved [Eimeria maxima]|uniref:Uncharacterized protein n=1 Tax=Eimeria maxima TaxID=5804 RepID=U6MGQ6_EIMMA|nr:hypothetical protein, conserved [Eimeria maxima]CDJ61629.1 hypothetical protein, conserved [Eimeria maxima]
MLRPSIRSLLQQRRKHSGVSLVRCYAAPIVLQQQQQQLLLQQQQQQQQQQYLYTAAAAYSTSTAAGGAATRATPAAATRGGAAGGAAAATTSAAATSAATAAAAAAARSGQGSLWGFIRREEPYETLAAFLRGERGDTRLMVLAGPEGIGKSSLLRHAANNLMQQQHKPPILLAFDVGLVEDRSFKGFFGIARAAAARQLAAACNDLNPSLLLQHVAAACPSFSSSVAAALRYAAAAAAATKPQQQAAAAAAAAAAATVPLEWLSVNPRGRNQILDLLKQLEEGGADIWESLLEVAIGPTNKAAGKPQTATAAALLLLRDAAVVKCKDIPEADAAKERPVTLLLRCPEALLLGHPLRVGGSSFFEYLLNAATQDERRIGTVFSVADGLTLLRVCGVHTPQEERNKRVYVVELDELAKAQVRELFRPILCTNTSVADASYLAVGGNPRLLRLIFEDLQKATIDFVKSLSKRTREGETNNSSIGDYDDEPLLSMGAPQGAPEGAPQGVSQLGGPLGMGGLQGHGTSEGLSGAPKESHQEGGPLGGGPQGGGPQEGGPQVDKSILEGNVFYRGELLRAAAAARGGFVSPFVSSPVSSYNKVSPLQGACNAEETVIKEFMNIQCMQQERLRKISEGLLVKEFRRFEGRMIQFLNFPLVKKLREVSKSEVHFLVVVCETVREFLRRPYLLCDDLGRISNTVLLGLLEANLIKPCLNPRRLVVSSVFIKNLLQAYCNQKYDALSTSQKAEFSLNLLLNQTAIRAALDDLKNPKP